MEPQELKKTIETLLFITEQPLTLKRFRDILDQSDDEKIAITIQELRREYEDRGSPVQILEIADGFQMASRSDYAPFVRKLYADKMTMRLSNAAMETLSIIAYKQPLTRAEIEEIRGVEVIAALETLLDKRLVRVVGRRESVGRPLLYGTTPDFMRHFGLKSLDDLPPIDTFTPPPPTETTSPVMETAGVAATLQSADVGAAGDETAVPSASQQTSSDPQAPNS